MITLEEIGQDMHVKMSGNTHLNEAEKLALINTVFEYVKQTKKHGAEPTKPAPVGSA